jgi:hypothetical protein
VKRGFWFVAGAGAGIYVSFRARRAAEAFTSDGISDRISALQLGARMLREDIAAAATAKEAELRERIGNESALRGSTTAALSAATDHPQEKELS